MNKHYSLISVALFLTVSCSVDQQTNSALNASSRENSSQTITQDTIIVLERNFGLFGIGRKCPYYKLTISSNGSVEIQPKSYDKANQLTDGKAIKSQITSEQVKQLITEAERINFYSLNSTYEDPSKNNVEDCPNHMFDSSTAITSITAGGKTHKVEDYHGCGASKFSVKMMELEDKIDEVVKTRQLHECYFGKY